MSWTEVIVLSLGALAVFALSALVIYWRHFRKCLRGLEIGISASESDGSPADAFRNAFREAFEGLGAEVTLVVTEGEVREFCRESSPDRMLLAAEVNAFERVRHEMRGTLYRIPFTFTDPSYKKLGSCMVEGWCSTNGEPELFRRLARKIAGHICAASD